MVSAGTCPTDMPDERREWPPLAGDYRVARYGAPVAVCTLNSTDLMEHLARDTGDALAIVGTMHTENLGIEHLIRNTVANANIRFLVLCGEDTRQTIGHLPGQSLESLFAYGMDERRRIVGARGKRPLLKNVSTEQVKAFVEQVELVSLIGNSDVPYIVDAVESCARRNPGPFDGGMCQARALEPIRAQEPKLMISDPAGFLVVYPDARRKLLVVEHYTNQGVLDSVIEGATPSAVYAEIIHRSHITRLDHAAYLGRELARAERTLRTGEPYVQDRAPGGTMPSLLTDAPCQCLGDSCSANGNTALT